MIRPTVYTATYHGTDAEWEMLAEYFENNHQKRMADTIRNGIERQIRRDKFRYDYEADHHSLRFKNGSIGKMNAALKELDGAM